MGAASSSGSAAPKSTVKTAGAASNAIPAAGMAAVMALGAFGA